MTAIHWVTCGEHTQDPATDEEARRLVQEIRQCAVSGNPGRCYQVRNS